MSIKRLLTIGLGLSALLIQSVQAVQLLQNNSFESWAINGPGGPPDYWRNVTTNFTSMQENVTVHGGSYAVKLNWGVSSRQDFAHRLLPVYGDSVYTCSLWIYDYDPSSRIRMWFSYDNGFNGPTTYSIDTAGWKLYVYNSTAPTGAKTLELQIRMYQVTSGVHTVYIDDISLHGPAGPYPDTVPIYSVQYSTDPGYPPDCFVNSMGERFIAVTGTVVGRYERSTRRNSFFIQDADSLWSGIFIYNAFDTVSLGDNVTISGIASEFEGQTEIGTIFGQRRNSSGNSLPPPKIVTCAQLGTDSCVATAEPYEGMYIQINNVTVTSAADFSDFYANDGSGDSCVVTNDVYYQGPNAPTINVGQTYSFIRGVGVYVNGRFAIAPRISTDVSQPGLRFAQQDYILESNTIVNSDRGRLDFTYMGAPKILYFNLNVNDNWQIVNMPLPSLNGPNVEQTLTLTFPIAGSIGIDVTSILYGFRLSDTVLTSMPPLSRQASVYSDTVLFCRGYGDTTFLAPQPAAPLIGDRSFDTTIVVIPGFPNQDCGRFESVPAAVSNSNLYLNLRHSLGIDEADLSIAEMKEIVGFVPNSGSPNWVANKRQAMQERRLPIGTELISGLSQLRDLLTDRNVVEIDVAITANGKSMVHSVPVLGIVRLYNGNFVFYIAHDTKQGPGNYGTKIEAVVYDINQAKFAGGSGLFDGASILQIVAEGPLKRTLDDATNPGKFVNVDNFVPLGGLRNSDPLGSLWLGLYPAFGGFKTIQAWTDNGDAKLSIGDTLTLADTATHDAATAMVIDVSPMVKGSRITGDTLYLDYFGIDPEVDPIIFVHGSYWQQVYPDYGSLYFCDDWFDNGDGVLDTSDLIVLRGIAGADSAAVFSLQVLDIAAGISTAAGCEYTVGDINGDGQRLGADVTYGVRFFKGIGPPPPDSCYLDSIGDYLYVAGDVNGNCEFKGSDITRLVQYFKGNAALSYCHFFSPPLKNRSEMLPLRR